MTKKEKVWLQGYLDGLKNWNNGQGLIITKDLASLFNEAGITGPYLVSQQLPNE